MENKPRTRYCFIPQNFISLIISAAYRLYNCGLIIKELSDDFEILPSRERYCRILKKMTKNRQQRKELWGNVLQKVGYNESLISASIITYTWNAMHRESNYVEESPIDIGSTSKDASFGSQSSSHRNPSSFMGGRLRISDYNQKGESNDSYSSSKSLPSLTEVLNGIGRTESGYNRGRSGSQRLHPYANTGANRSSWSSISSAAGLYRHYHPDFEVYRDSVTERGSFSSLISPRGPVAESNRSSLDDFKDSFAFSESSSRFSLSSLIEHDPEKFAKNRADSLLTLAEVAKSISMSDGGSKEAHGTRYPPIFSVGENEKAMEKKNGIDFILDNQDSK